MNLDWFFALEISVWQIIFIAYLIAGAIKIILDAPFFYNEWKNFDERLNEKISSMEIEQMSRFNYRIIKYGSLSIMFGMAWFFWPFVQTAELPIKK